MISADNLETQVFLRLDEYIPNILSDGAFPLYWSNTINAPLALLISHINTLLSALKLESGAIN